MRMFSIFTLLTLTPFFVIFGAAFEFLESFSYTNSNYFCPDEGDYSSLFTYSLVKLNTCAERRMGANSVFSEIHEVLYSSHENTEVILRVRKYNSSGCDPATEMEATFSEYISTNDFNSSSMNYHIMSDSCFYKFSNHPPSIEDGKVLPYSGAGSYQHVERWFQGMTNCCDGGVIRLKATYVTESSSNCDASMCYYDFMGYQYRQDVLENGAYRDVSPCYDFNFNCMHGYTPPSLEAGDSLDVSEVCISDHCDYFNSTEAQYFMSMGSSASPCKPNLNIGKFEIKGVAGQVVGTNSLLVRFEVAFMDSVQENDRFRVVIKEFDSTKKVIKNTLTSGKYTIGADDVHSGGIYLLMQFSLREDHMVNNIYDNLRIKIKNRVHMGGRAFERDSCTKFNFPSLDQGNISEEDTSPPEIHSLSFSPSTVDTSSSEQHIVVTAHITDDLAGVAGYSYSSSQSQILFYSPSQSQSVVAMLSEGQLMSGDSKDGTYSYQMVVPQHSEAGQWKVEYLYLVDNVGNQNYIYENDLIAAGYSTTFEVSTM